jgi:Ca-activated chloride channel family protein
MNIMNKLLIILILFVSGSVFAQSSQKLIRQGNNHYKEDNYKNAEISYRKAIENNKSDKKNTAKTKQKAFYNLGNSLYKQDQYEQAQGAYAKSIESVNKKSANALYNVGNSLLQSNKLEESIETYKEVLRMNPKDEDARYNLAYAMSKLKQQQQNQQNKNDKKDDKNKDENQQNQQDKQDKQDKSDEQNKQQQQQQNKMTKEDAERMLNALNNNEQKTMDKVKKKLPPMIGTSKPEKDW